MNRPLDIRPGDRILVSRTDRLGDLILALPLVESLKLRYPECRVDVLASLYASPVLENNERIDGILRVQNQQLGQSRHYRNELKQNIGRAKYRAAVVVYPDRQISRLLYQAGVTNRIGPAGRFHSVFFNHHLIHSRKANKKHEMEYNLDFLSFFQNGPTVSQPVVHTRAKELRYARRILDDAGAGERFIVLHPGSGGSAHRWPLSKFRQLYHALIDRGIETVITGSADEAATYAEWGSGHQNRAVSIAGQTDLRTLAAVLAQAAAVIANSTGPLHLAAAVGTRVAGLYPRRKVMSPVRWGPVGKDHLVFQPSMPECDCPPKECLCMSTIPVESVAARVVDLIRNEDAAK